MAIFSHERHAKPSCVNILHAPPELKITGTSRCAAWRNAEDNTTPKLVHELGIPTAYMLIRVNCLR